MIRVKIKFEGELITNITFQRKTLKLKTFVLKNTENLFNTDWMEKFKLWDMAINSFCQKPKKPDHKGKKFNKRFKRNFSKSFF